MITCKNCKHFVKALHPSIFGVLGFCMDEDNPTFGRFAKLYGRGLTLNTYFKKVEGCKFKTK